MQRATRLASTAAAIVLAVPAPAAPVSLGDLFTIDRLAGIGVTWALTAMRSFAHVTFIDMDVRPLDARMVLTGLEVTPFDSMGFGPDCTFTLDRAVIASAPLLQFKRTALDIDLLGVTVAQGCLDPSTRATLAQFGIESITFDHATLGVNYTFASGALSVDAVAVSAGLADIRAVAEFDYFAVDAAEEIPVADLVSAELEVTDLGLMQRLDPMLPPESRDADALATLLRAMFLPEAPPGASDATPTTRQPGTKVPPSPRKQKTDNQSDTSESDEAPFIIQPPRDPDLVEASEMLGEAAQSLAGFVTAPGRIALTLRPEAPVRLSENVASDFVDFARTFRPELVAGPLVAPARLVAADAAAIAAASDGTSDTALAPADRLRYARAFLTGIGAPRDAGFGAALLSPLLETGDSAALALALDQLDALDPQTAYRVALGASASGNRRAFAHLDGLERALDIETMLAVQSSTGDPVPPPQGEPSRDTYQRGFHALTGLGAPRSYMTAYFYALYALAGGDRTATAIVDEIEAIGDGFEAKDAATWDAELSAVRAVVREAWFAPH